MTDVGKAISRTEALHIARATLMRAENERCRGPAEKGGESGMSVRILRNRARCKLCNDEIESRFRHDYVPCSCGSIAVDGGLDYLKRTGLPDQIIELSECEEDV